MYCIETYKNDAFHKYVASMTGAVVKGQEVDEGAYQFERAVDCDRVIRIINKVYGTAKNGTVVVRREIGKETVSVKEPEEESAIKEVVGKCAIKEVVAPPLGMRTKESTKFALVQRLLTQPAIPPQNPWDRTTNDQSKGAVTLSAIVKATQKNKNNTVKANITEKEIGGEINFDDLESIGNEQYMLDESGGDF